MAPKSFITFNEDGTVAKAGFGEFSSPDRVAFTPAFQPSDLASMMLVKRPDAPELVEGEGTNEYLTTPCPIGTSITINDQIGEETMHTAETTQEGEVISFQITDPGTYQVLIEPPMPYLPRIVNIVIEEV